jgi:predicted MFS family arabinose efflux permease
VDYFIYGVVTSVADHTPDHATGDGQFRLLHSGYAVGVLTAAPLFGYLGARIGLKRSMICGAALLAGAMSLYGIAPGSALLFLAQLLQGAASAATWTAGLSLIAQRHVERRVEMMGYALIGSTLGDGTGALLHQIGGNQMPFMVAGALVAIDAGLRVFVLPSDRTGRQSLAGLRPLVLDKSVLMSAAAVGLAAIGWSIVDTLLPARLGRVGVAPPFIGLIFLAASFVYGVCAPLLEWVSKRVPSGRVIAGGTLAMAIALPLLGIVQGIIATAAAVCVVSVCYAFILDPTTAELGNAVDRRGMTCYSAVYAIFNVAYAIGMVAIDTIFAAAWLDVPQVLLCISFALIFATPFLWRTA